MAGRSGYCTVACSEGMREALQLSLEQISYYDHLASAGGGQPVVHAYRMLNIRGSQYYVLSRIADAGQDFTNRTNFIAHHLVFQSSEIQTLGSQSPSSPAVIFLHWDGWRNGWDSEPQQFKDEKWGNLFSLAENSYNPARHWKELTGDAANGLTLWDNSAQEFISTDDQEPQKLLALIAESLALAVVRPLAGGPWQQTFTTFLQERDAAIDFRWRMVHSGTVAFDRLVSRNAVIKPLATLRFNGTDELAMAFARTGPQPLRLTVQPEDKKLRLGEPLVLKVAGAGVPPPAQYQWYTCSRTGSRQIISGATGPELRMESPPRGVSRYQATVADNHGRSVESRIATIEMELDKTPAYSGARQKITPATHKPTLVRPDEELKVQPKQWEDADTNDDEWESDETTEEDESPGLNWKWIGMGAFLVIFGAMAIFLFRNLSSPAASIPVGATNGPPAMATNSMENAPTQIVNRLDLPPVANPESTVPKSPPKLALIVLETNVDLAAIKAATDQIAAVSDEKSKNDAEQKELEKTYAAEKEKKDTERKQKIIDVFPSVKKAFDRRDGEFKRLLEILANQLALLRQKYDKQKERADQEFEDKLGKLFDLSPGQPAHIQIMELNQSQPIQVDGAGSFDISTGDSNFRLLADTHDTFGITGIEVQKNNLGAPLLASIAPDIDFTNSTSARLLIWPAATKISATCNEKGDLTLFNSRFLDVLDEFNSPEKYKIEINIGYLKGPSQPGQYACTTSFLMVKSQHYVFSDLENKLSGWRQTLTIVTNIMALGGSQSSSSTASNIWDDLGNICQRLTSSRVPYYFKEDPESYKAARNEVVGHLGSEDNRSQVKSILSDENLENLKSFLKDEPNLITLDSVKDRLRSLLPPTGTRLNERLQASITFQNVKLHGSKEALAQIIFSPNHN